MNVAFHPRSVFAQCLLPYTCSRAILGTGLMQKMFSRRVMEVLCLVLVFVAYFFLKRANLHLLAGDQGVYFYAGSLWAQGILPYRDFFISHPPLQLLIPALFIKLFGVHLMTLNLLPALFGAFSGLLLLRLAWKPLGSVKAMISVALFLLSYANLLSTLYYTGQNLALLLLLFASLLFLNRQKFLAGLMLGFAQMVGIHILFPFAALVILQFFWNRRKLPVFLGGFFVSSGAIHALFSMIAGKEFWRMIYLYHLAKPKDTPYLFGKWTVFVQMLQGNLFIAMFALIGAFLLFRSLRQEGADENPEKQRLLLLATSVLCAYLFFLGTASPVFPHYFVPLAPFATLLAAETTGNILSTLRRLFQERRILEMSLIVPPLFLLLVWSTYRNIDYYNREQTMLAFDHAEIVAGHVRNSLKPEETIYGDFAIVPTIALLSARRIAGDEVDSSVMRFASGMYRLDGLLEKIENDHVRALLTRSHKDILSYPPMQEYVRTRFRLAETFPSSRGGSDVELWLRF